MKRIIVTGVVSAIAAVSFAGTASAAPAPDGPACFGQVHKSVNVDKALSSLGVNNVGDLVQSEVVKQFGNKGQGKNAAANLLFCS